MVVVLRFTSKILIIVGFNFSSPVVSVNPSILNVNGCDLQCSTRHFLHDGANVSLRIKDVLVLPQSKD